MNGLYHIIPDGDGVFRVRLNPAHPIFRGHFPDKPILPGVCSLMIVRECASRMAGAALKFSAVKESKFLSAITPDSEKELTVKLHFASETGVYNASATVCGGETVMLKLKATLEADE